MPYPVYYVESCEDDTVLIGIKVTIVLLSLNCFEISWWDPCYERRMISSKIKKDGDNLSFKRIEEDGGQMYHFRPMTLEIYNDKVKENLLERIEFDNEVDMINAFLKATDEL